MEKKGLSNLIVTVSIVLVSLVAVGIIFVFITPLFEGGGAEFQAQTKCSSVSVEPQNCLVIPGDSTNAVVVRVGVTDGVAQGIAASVEYDDASRETDTLVASDETGIGTYQTRVLDGFEVPPSAYTAVRARAAPVVLTEGGEEYVCEESFVSIMCGDDRCTSDSECAANEDCINGICTVFDSQQTTPCGGNDDCSDGDVCVDGYCVPSDSPQGGGCWDDDEDGYDDDDCGGFDCDDSDVYINPAADEGTGFAGTCVDGYDNDCDGDTDEEDSDCLAPVSCTDNDGDNYYLESSGCEGEPGFLGHNDCDDDDEYEYPDQDWGADRDGDDYVDPLSIEIACEIPGEEFIPLELSMDGGDCDEYNPSRNPGATEVCDMVDNDCDGVADDVSCPPESCGEDGGVTECFPGSQQGYVRFTPGDGDCDASEACYILSGPTCEGGVGTNCEMGGCSPPLVDVPEGHADCQARYGFDTYCCDVSATPCSDAGGVCSIGCDGEWHPAGNDECNPPDTFCCIPEVP